MGAPPPPPGSVVAAAPPTVPAAHAAPGSRGGRRPLQDNRAEPSFGVFGEPAAHRGQEWGGGVTAGMQKGPQYAANYTVPPQQQHLAAGGVRAAGQGRRAV